MARYRDMLRRHQMRFVLMLLIAPLTLSCSSLLLFRTYQATASLWIESPSNLGQTFAPAGWNPTHSPAENETENLRQLLAIHSFDEQVHSGLVTSGAISDGEALGPAVDSLGSDFNVAPVGSHLVRLTYTSARPALAVAVLKTTISLFQKHREASQQEEQDLSDTFFSAQVAAAESRLAVSEGALNAYLSAHPGLSPPGPDLTGTIPELDRLAIQVRQTQADLGELRAQFNQARFEAAAARRLVETNTKVLDSPRIDQAGLAGDGNSVSLALAVALLCIAAAIGYLVVAVWGDQTARDGKELERRLKVRVLTTIPMIRLQERA